MGNNIVQSTLLNHPFKYILINYSLLNWKSLSNQLSDPSVDVHTNDYHLRSNLITQNAKLIA